MASLIRAMIYDLFDPDSDTAVQLTSVAVVFGVLFVLAGIGE